MCGLRIFYAHFISYRKSINVNKSSAFIKIFKLRKEKHGKMYTIRVDQKIYIKNRNMCFLL